MLLAQSVQLRRPSPGMGERAILTDLVPHATNAFTAGLQDTC